MSDAAFIVRVYLEDVDAGGIVYHANYLKYAERARTEWLKERGVSHAGLMTSGQGAIIVAELAIIYRTPAHLEDVLAVSTQIINIGAASADLRQVITRESVVVAELKVTLACVNPEGRPKRWPPELRRAFGETEQKDV
jgi:acyl-CoA thioester hydrolase